MQHMSLLMYSRFVVRTKNTAATQQNCWTYFEFSAHYHLAKDFIQLLRHQAVPVQLINFSLPSFANTPEKASAMLLSLCKPFPGCTNDTVAGDAQKLQVCCSYQWWRCHTCEVIKEGIGSRFSAEWKLCKARCKTLHDHAAERLVAALAVPRIRDVIGMRRWYASAETMMHDMKMNEDVRVVLTLKFRCASHAQVSMLPPRVWECICRFTDFHVGFAHSQLTIAEFVAFHQWVYIQRLMMYCEARGASRDKKNFYDNVLGEDCAEDGPDKSDDDHMETEDNLAGDMDPDLGDDNEKPAHPVLPEELLEIILRKTRLDDAAGKVSKAGRTSSLSKALLSLTQIMKQRPATFIHPSTSDGQNIAKKQRRCAGGLALNTTLDVDQAVGERDAAIKALFALELPDDPSEENMLQSSFCAEQEEHSLPFMIDLDATQTPPKALALELMKAATLNLTQVQACAPIVWNLQQMWERRTIQTLPWPMAFQISLQLCFGLERAAAAKHGATHRSSSNCSKYTFRREALWPWLQHTQR
jgi:hypothetical protein